MNIQPEDIIPNMGIQKNEKAFNKIISENEKPIVIIGKSSNDMAIKASIPVIKSQPISIKINTGSGILQNVKHESKHTNEQTLDVLRISNYTKTANIQSVNLSCMYCGKSFIQQHLYNNHILVCPHIGKTKTYSCIYCHLDMDSKKSFFNHKKTCPKRTTRNKHILHEYQTNKTVKKLTNSKDIDTEESLSSEDEESENNISIIYDDDDDDINKDEYLDEDEDYEKSIFKRKTKHLGPILINGKFKCRDCLRTFSKDEQYKRHIKACTNAPLNASRIDLDFLPENSKNCDNKTASSNTLKRKRGRPRKNPLSKDVINISTEVENHGKIILNKNTDDDFSDIARKNHIDITWKDVDNSENQHIIDKMAEKEFLSLEMEYKQLEKSPNTSVRTKEMESKDFCEQSIEELFISSISTGESECASNNNCQFSENVENYHSHKSNCNVAMELYINCALCNEKLLNKSEYAAHLTKFHQEDVNNMYDLLSGHTSLDTFVCPLCHLFYVSTNLLLYHLVCVHTELLQSIYREVLKSEKENGKTSCPWCNEISYTQQLHLEHLAIDHHKIFETKKKNNQDNTNQEIIKESITIKEYHNDSLHKENKGKQLDIRMVKAHKSNNQEFICPDCGSYFKTLGFLNHHQKSGACERQVKKNFICTETECNGRSFYRLQNLFKHMKKVHGKTVKCRKMKFKSYNNFMDWLQSEELKHKVRYISTFRKPNKNHVSQTLVCHRFNTAHSDRRNEMRKEAPQRQWCAKIPRSAHCFARLYTVTLRNPQNGRYEGITQVTYYEDHNHSPVDQSPDIFERVMERHARNKKDQRKICISARTEGGATSLHQNKKFKLNINDLNMENNNKKDNLEMVIEDGVMDTGVLLEGDLQNEASYLLWPSDAIVSERIENTTNETNRDINDSRMVYVVQNEEFLVQDVSGKDFKNEETEDMMQNSYINLLDEHLIDKQDNLVSSLNSAESSNQQIIGSSNNDGNKLLFLDEKEFSTIGETTQSITSTDESFVIPADLSEWNKLFELLSCQIESGALDVDNTVRGINLLAYQDSITEMSLKEQVNIFNELCDITNVQVD